MSAVSSGAELDQEPGVDADAVPAHAGARAQDLDPRVAVGQGDRLPHVDAEAIGQAGELVGRGDVDVAVGVLHQLDHLGRRGVGEHDLAAHEGGVQIAPRLGRRPVEPADDAGVLDQLAQDLAGQDAFG